VKPAQGGCAPHPATAVISRRAARVLLLLLAPLAASCGDGRSSAVPSSTASPRASASATGTAPPPTGTARPPASATAVRTASATLPATATATPTLAVPTGTASATATVSAGDRCVGRTGAWGTRQVAIQSGGLQRTFLLSVPESALRGAPVPLLLLYHGSNGDGAKEMGITGFDRKAAAEGFIAAAGDGTSRSWNSGFCRNPDGAACVTDVDDVGFTRDMVAAIGREYCIDPQRVYATGFSKGATMVFRLACEASDLFAGFAPVAGGFAFAPCEPAAPRPLQIINGSADAVAPPGLGRLAYEEFVGLNGCNEVRETTSPAATASCELAPQCVGGAVTEFCTVDVAHHWPGGATDPDGEFAATDAIWQFFVAHEPAERITLRTVPLPAGVGGARFPWYSSSGERILFSAQPAGSGRVETLTIRADGSEFRCLTCGVAPEIAEPLLKPIPFPDNRRVLIRVGEQNLAHAADHAVLECVPDVDNCAAAELVPIVIPPPGDAVVSQDQRELRVAPDGEHLGFTQVRETASGDGGFVAAVARLVRAEHEYELSDARVVSTRGELKQFTPDGQAVLVAAFTTNPYAAANPDVLRVDLTSGTESRVTYDPDYDEPLEFSPDGTWYVVGGGRGSGLFATVSQLRRPNFIGAGLEPLVAALFIQYQEELIEPWLVRAGTERLGATGQLLNPASAQEGYGGRAIPNWHPDGTRIVFWEGSSNPAVPPTSATRIVVAQLDDRVAQGRPASGRSPEPLWAAPLEGFVPPEAETPVSRAGHVSGTIDITAGPAADDRTALEVTYRNFSDDGEWVIEGSERAEYKGGLTGQTSYTADLSLVGTHRGFLRAAATISVGGIAGSIDSEVDGTHHHLPRPSPSPAS
jgi:poly(3-hydroxybutyrate) depolymerase